MAKDKTKDEVKADIVDQEVDAVAKGRVDSGAGAAKGKSKNAKKTAQPAAKTSKKTVKTTADSGKQAAAKAVKETDNGATKKSDKAKTEANSQDEKVSETPAAAKAGKRSPKALKEAEAKQAKQERKAEQPAEATDRPKPAQPPARSRLERRAKGYRQSAAKIEPGKIYGLNEALNLASQTSHVKFDATVELHIRLGIDPRQADQNLRDTVTLPAGTGKKIRVAVFGDDEAAAAAKAAGADLAGGDEFLQQLDKGVVDFDVLVATPAAMPRLGKYARMLGPKGLMPNPKSGTVTTDVAKAVSEAKAGRVEYRVDSTGIVHVGIGKVSFGKDKLISNARAILTSIKTNKPGSLKGNYVRSVHVTTSMGPSIKVENSEI